MLLENVGFKVICFVFNISYVRIFVIGNNFILLFIFINEKCIIKEFFYLVRIYINLLEFYIIFSIIKL